jgi:8-oxo-dGTP pyrophosphatase MutT (NUDIX family)
VTPGVVKPASIMLDLPQKLAERLRQPLPGRAAQRRFEPEMSFGRHFGPPPTDAYPAAVLVLLFRHENAWYVPLTIRPTTMLTHAGQISLPGGRIEPGESSAQAVLRELDEELGVRGEIELLGQLSDLYLFGSNYMVTPWVATSPRRPDFRPSPVEVAELLEVPLAHLLDPKSAGLHARRQRGVALSAPHFLWGRHRIWGATSMILAELIEVLNSLDPAGSKQSP